MPNESKSNKNDEAGFQAIYHNKEVLVLQKPHNIPMDGDDAERPTTVETWATSFMQQHGIYDAEHDALQRDKKRKKQLKFVHQLDYATSGVLCVAFTKDMASRLAHGFEMRTTHKAYLALVCGHVPQVGPSCSQWIESLNTKLAQVCSDDNKEDEQTVVEAKSTTPFVQLVSSESAASSFFEHSGDEPCNNSSDGTREGKAAVVEQYFTSDNAKQAYKAIRTSFRSSGEMLIEVNLPIGYDTTDEKGFRMAVTPIKSRPSTTHMHVLERGFLAHPESGECLPVTKLLLVPRTGRRHQLRVHCHALGFPILGDVAYPPEASSPISGGGRHTALSAGWERMYLHAWYLSLPCSLAAVGTETQRVESKKKRRRETLGLDDALGGVQQRTEFVSEDVFPTLQSSA